MDGFDKVLLCHDQRWALCLELLDGSLSDLAIGGGDVGLANQIVRVE